MEKKMKLRLILMFTILPIIMVALSVSTVLVARQVTVGTKMNVTFTSNEIDCKITGSAKYKTTGKEGNYTNAKVVGSTSTSKTLTFAAGVDYNGTYSIDFEKIDIDANGEAIYAFSIENTGSKSICAKVTVGNVNNMVRNITSGEYITNAEGVSGYIIHAGQTKDFEIKLTVNDKSIDASATSEISMVLANEFPASEIAAKAVDQDGTVLAVATTGSSTIQLPTNTKTTSIDDNGTTKYFQGYIKSNSTTSNLSGDDQGKNYSYSAITALPSNLILPYDDVTISTGDIFTSYYDIDPDYSDFTIGYVDLYDVDWNYQSSVLAISKYSGSSNTVVIPTLYRGQVITYLGESGEYSESGPFDGCTGLTSVTIPNSVTSIGYMSFAGCTGLTSITIPNSVTSIGDYAFLGCAGLTSLTLSNTLTSMGDSVFGGCSNLVTISGGSEIYKAAGNCIIYTSSKAVTFGCKGSVIPSDGSVTQILFGAFSNCTGLTSITIPNSVTGIGGSAFSGCTNLSSITFENSSNWYRTDSYDNMNNKSNGTLTDLSNVTTNATYFKSTYSSNYWYKL